MDNATIVFAHYFLASWQFRSSAWKFHEGDPFERRSLAVLDQAIDEFVVGPRNRRLFPPSPDPPSFTSNFFKGVSAPTELIPTGRTASVKFATTAGVFTPKLSYRMYFSPFLPTVWLSIVISGGISLVTIMGALKMQRTQKNHIGCLTLAMELATWIFATTIGQYQHSDVPLISKRLCRKVLWIVAPVVVLWFILSTFIFNVYSAIFSSEATRSFYYETNYTELLQLPLNSLTYILANESYFRRYPYAANAKKPCLGATFGDKFCQNADGVHPAACDILRAMREALGQLRLKAISKITNPNSAIDHDYIQQPHLDEKYSKLWTLMMTLSFLRANTKCVSRVLLESELPLIFLVSDYDFQKYWEVFVRVMQSNPNVKVANNFYSDDSLLSRPVVYKFTSGLHPVLKGSVVARFKLLLSSGIYSLWQRWHRIKFTDGGLKHEEKKLLQDNKVDPVSFSNSGTPWIFHAQACVYLVATGVFIVEVFKKYLGVGRFGVNMDY